MFFLSKFICICYPFVIFLIMIIRPIFSQQSYDNTECTSLSQSPGSKYLCSSDNTDCDTFIVYRAQTNLDTISAISPLFTSNLSDVLPLNKNIEDHLTSVEVGREVIIPITCQCLNGFSRAIIRYNFSSTDSFASVACGVFEGLAKAQSLFEENPNFKGHDPFDPLIHVPIKCACPGSGQRSRGVNHLVTYPIVENDHLFLIARKFSISEGMIRDANKLGPRETIFPRTTVLIPTKDVPAVNWSIGPPPGSPPGPRTATPLRKVVNGERSHGWNSNVFFGVGAFMLVLVVGWTTLCINIKKVLPTIQQSVSSESAASCNVSPDFLDRVSKLKQSLITYSLEELKNATKDFDEDFMIGTEVYKGRLGGSFVAIKPMDSEESASKVVYILTKINHYNIVKLQGWCHGNKPHLVYEFAENGSLRDCLSNAELHKQLTWARRKQIAFDLAVALHYLHYCTTPAFVHRNLSSGHVLITTDWRAKICGFRLVKQLTPCQESEKINWNESVIVGAEGYLSPEYLTKGQASLKVDIYAFGVVLLELLSAKEITADGKSFKESIDFLVNGGLEGSSECLEKLKGFMDPVLAGEYPFGHAMLFALLGKACIAEDSYSRPTMNNVLRTLSRIL